MNRRKIKALSYAKINLSLNVSGKTSGGLHLLDSVTASVDFTDAVTVCERFDSRVNITYNGENSRYERDSIMLAIDCLRKRFGPFGLDIAVDKHLPEGAGLGGSSADAAAVLVLADRLFGFFDRGFDISVAAAEVGSDVPVMMSGGYCRLTGIGDKVTKLSGNKLDFVLYYGDEGVPTGKCFELFDEKYISGRFAPADNEELTMALCKGDLNTIARQCKNALTLPASLIDKNIEKRLEALIKTGAKAAFLTGSGSCCVGLFESSSSAESASKCLNERKECIGFAMAVSTVPYGVEVI